MFILEFLFKCDMELSCGYFVWIIIVIDFVDICGGGFVKFVDFRFFSGCIIYWNCKFIWCIKVYIYINFIFKNFVKVYNLF